MKLYIIAGHGAGDSGACGNGFQEAERVRALCSKIKAYGGDSVVYLDPSKNWYATKGLYSLSINGSDCLLECHMDSGGAGAKGSHVIIPSGVGGADKYDNALANFVSSVFPGRANKIVERSDLQNCNISKRRGINYRLCEYGFISSAEDVKIFNSRLDDIAIGTLKAFGITSHKVGWNKDNKGWWYCYANGTYPKSQWLKLDTWYYFGKDGYAYRNKWVKHSDGKWYYLGDDCRMYANQWVKYKDEWYYFDTSGVMVTSKWVVWKDKKYYMKEDGIMAHDETIEINETEYTFDSNGLVV